MKCIDLGKEIENPLFLTSKELKTLTLTQNLRTSTL